MRRTVTIGPISASFSNENPLLGIPPHTHYCRVTLAYETLGRLGFPVLEETITAVKRRVKKKTEKHFAGTTNEEIAELLFNAFESWCPPGTNAGQSKYKLFRLDLEVYSAEDTLGHADGVAVYSIERSP